MAAAGKPFPAHGGQPAQPTAARSGWHSYHTIDQGSHDGQRDPALAVWPYRHVLLPGSGDGSIADQRHTPPVRRRSLKLPSTTRLRTSCHPRVTRRLPSGCVDQFARVIGTPA